MADSFEALVALFATLYTDESAGLLVEIVVPVGDYSELPTLELNTSVVASGVSIVAGSATAHEQRRLASSSGDATTDSSKVTLTPMAGHQLLRTLPGAPNLRLRGLTMQGAVHVNGSRVDLDECTTFDGGNATEGGALAVVDEGVVEAKACNFTRNSAVKGGAVLIDSGRGVFANCRFEENDATDGGSALHVRSTTGEGVVLTGGTLFVHNSEPSIMRTEGQVTYKLPAPLGRFLNAAGASQQSLNSSVAADFPLACAPGISGASDLESAQNGPWCTELCPAGFMCPGATGEPQPCGAGGYCAGSNAFATPCPEGRYSNATGLASADGCLPCLAGSACLAGSKAPTVCASGSFAPGLGTATCQQCEAGSYQASRNATACDICPLTAWCAEGSSAPTPCGPGNYSDQLGLRSADECLRCSEGSWCSAGKAIPCGLGTYNDGVGASDQSACTYCPPNSFTNGESKTSLADCICEANYYGTISNGSLLCQVCPVGSDCTAPGSILQQLYILTGYYRTSSLSNELRRCPDHGDNSGCVGGLGVGEGPCKLWLTGPYCRLCNVTDTSRYYDGDKSECLPCEGSVAVPLVLGVVAVLATVVIVLLWLRFKPHRHIGSLDRLSQRLSRLYNQLSLRAKGKQLLGFYQVATRVASVYEVPMPESVKQFEAVAFGLRALQH